MKLPASFKPVYRYKMEDGKPRKRKLLDEALWGQKGVVYARVYRDRIVYIGKADGRLCTRILRHLNRISKETAGMASQYRKWAKGKTITILAHRPEPVRRFGLQIELHSGIEAALIRKFKPRSMPCKQPWFVKRT